MKSLRSVIAKAACMLTLAAVSNSFVPADAQQRPGQIILNEPGDNIRFVSTEGDMLVFELHLNNPLAKGSMIRITDGENNVIFEETTEKETYNVRYKIVRNNMSQINFEISNRHFFHNQSFNINLRTEEKIEVTNA